MAILMLLIRRYILSMLGKAHTYNQFANLACMPGGAAGGCPLCSHDDSSGRRNAYSGNGKAHPNKREMINLPI